MDKASAGQRATERANATGKNYVVIAAGNGQWMCETEHYATRAYPENAERVVVSPSPRAAAIHAAKYHMLQAREMLESVKSDPTREEVLDLLHTALQTIRLMPR